MGKLPAILLYDGDWIKDTVSGCSLAAQGLWLRMMFLGHNSERYGYLCQNGAAIPSGSIARRCGCTPEQYATLFAELDSAGVPSRTPEGIIYSRRMVRDAQKRELARKRKEKERKNGNSHAGVTRSVTQMSVTVNENVNLLRPKKPIPKESPPEDSDSMIQTIANTHPKFAKPFETERAIVEQLDRLGDEMGVRNALDYLLSQTRKYRELWKKWPKDKQDFSPESPRWFASGCYAEPEKNWAEKAAGPHGVDEHGGHMEGNTYVTKDGKRMTGYKPITGKKP